jgi:hypothetical protein
MYDIFYIGKRDNNWKSFKENYITAKQADSILDAQSKSLTDFFYAVPNDVIVNDFDFDYTPDNWSKEYVHVFKNTEKFDGIALIPKRIPILNREWDYRFFVNKKEVDQVVSKPKPYDIFEIDSYEQYQYALENSTTDMFWMVSSEIKYNKEFLDNFYISHHDSSLRKQTHAFGHQLEDEVVYNGVFLCSKQLPLSKREVEYRFPVNKIEHEEIISEPRLYDIYNIKNYEDYKSILDSTNRELFWLVPDDVEPNADFFFDLHFPFENEYDRKINHVFLNGEVYDGIVLASKHTPILKREFEHRFIISKKEHAVQASTPKSFPKYDFKTYDEYINTVEKCTVDMFWWTPDDVIVENFDYSMYIDHHNSYDRSINHVFKNGDYYDGIVLFSKKSIITRREFEHRFITHKKEHDIIASKPKPYDVFEIETLDDYQNALQETSQDMFWMSSPNIRVNNDLINNFTISHHESVDRKQNHSFIHQVEDRMLRNGLYLCTVHTPVTEREIKYRFLANRKEWDEVGSYPTNYDVFEVDSYEEYEYALNNSYTEMFYAVPSHIKVNNSFKFDDYFSHDNEFDRTVTHVFKNGEYHDGLKLFSKHSPIASREFEYGFIIHKKELDITASLPAEFDVVFISYNEPNADENYERLLSKFPNAKRVHGVKGIHQAHIEAAKICTTKMFFVVDGDAQLVDDFTFNYQVPLWNMDMVHVWRSKNPVNGLEYGYGGVKLLPRELTINVDINSPDMTTSISNKLKVVESVSNYSMFNTDEFSTWKSAFRECVKLSSKTIRGQVNEDTERRLKIWCERGSSAEFGRYSISGACSGRDYGYDNRDRPDKLNLINDFDWLYEQFSKHTLG